MKLHTSTCDDSTQHDPPPPPSTHPPPPTMPWPSRNKILIRVNICVQLYLIINCFNVRPWQIKNKTKHKTVPNTKAWSDDEGFLLNHLMSIKIQTETDAHITDEYTRQSLQIDTKIHTVLQEDGLCVCSKIFSGGNIPLVHSSTVIFKYNPSPPAVDFSRSDLRIAAGISLTLYKIKRPDTRRRPETHVSTWNHRLCLHSATIRTLSLPSISCQVNRCSMTMSCASWRTRHVQRWCRTQWCRRDTGVSVWSRSGGVPKEKPQHEAVQRISEQLQVTVCFYTQSYRTIWKLFRRLYYISSMLFYTILLTALFVFQPLSTLI